MICSQCKNQINLTEQIKEWEEMYGDEARPSPDFPIYIAIYCENCDEVTACIWLEQADETVEMTDFKGDKVILKKSKKKK